MSAINLRNLYLISQEDFKNLFKNPMWLFYNLAFPFLLIVVLGFLQKDSYGEAVSAFDYYGITLMIYTVISSGMTSANAFIEVTIRIPNMRIIYAPGNERVIYLAKIVSSFGFCLLCHLTVAVLTFTLFKIRVDAIPQLLILLVLMELFSVALGVMFCCIFKTEATANQILSIVINIFALLGGLLFPMDGYGAVVRSLSYLSPAKWLANTSFAMIYDHNFSWFYPTVMGLILATMVVFIICAKTFRKEDCIC
nr:ABC transporter permease [uncultured Acetobacterium sp.]